VDVQTEANAKGEDGKNRDGGHRVLDQVGGKGYAMLPLENPGTGVGRACQDVLKNVYQDVKMMEAVSIGVEAQRHVREVFNG
jgi:hypothetical protein